MDDLHHENANLRSHTDYVEKTRIQQSKEIFDLEVRVDQLEIENSALRDSVSKNAEIYAQESEALRTKYQSQIELLESQLSTSQKRCIQFEKDSTLIAEALRLSKAKLERTLASNKELKDQMKDLESQLTMMNQKLMAFKQPSDSSFGNLELSGSINPVIDSNSYRSVNSSHSSQVFSIKLKRIEPESIKLSFANLRPRTVDYRFKNPILSPKTSRLATFEFTCSKVDSGQVFMEYAYLWTKNTKVLILMAASQSKIVLFEYGNFRDPILSVKYDSLLRICKVPDSPNLNVISFLDHMGNELNIVLEIYPTYFFISFLLRVKCFNVNRISTNSFNLCSRQSNNLLFASLLSQNDACGFLDMKTESFFETWQPVFLIFKQSLLVILRAEVREKLLEDATGRREGLILSLKRLSVSESIDSSDSSSYPILIVATGSFEDSIELRSNSLSQHKKWLTFFENLSRDTV